MTDARALLLDRLSDGRWHSWRDLASLAERKLGTDMGLAAEMTTLLRDGRVRKHEDRYEYVATE